MSALLAERARRAERLVEETAFRARRGGRIRAAEGLLLTAEGLDAPVGALLMVEAADGGGSDWGSAGAAGASPGIPAEVIGFRDNSLLLMALGPGAVQPGAAAWLMGPAGDVPAGAALLGRVAGALGEPLDGLGPFHGAVRWPLAGRPLSPLDRGDVSVAMPTGVRAIDALLTLGRGQRVGLIAGSGVGKSVLMQQLVRGADVDCVVVALVGERGREISGFLGGLGPAERARTFVVAVPADAAAPARVRGCLAAFSAAEALRHDGLHVLLLVDSLTRVAQAQREIGLAAGEPAGVRGYPPSALSLIPRLVERAGNDSRTGGAITAVATVLADGDDTIADPVVDTARGVLDGHIVLDRAIAARGRYPAIDLAHSLSRTMPACVPPAHLVAATAFRRDLALAEANQDLVAMGAYVRGADPAVDRALERRPELEGFLQQGRDETMAFADAAGRLLTGWGRA
jgi:flagellum-specific ATP synthase